MEMPDGCLHKNHKNFVSKNEANIEAKSLFSTAEKQSEGGKITGLFTIEEFLAMRRENEELKAEKKHWKAARQSAIFAGDKMKEDNDELKAKLDKAKDALRFYGDNHEYPNDGAFGSGSTDFGHRARTTLEEIK